MQAALAVCHLFQRKAQHRGQRYPAYGELDRSQTVPTD
jgi:hypothetical protein